MINMYSYDELLEKQILDLYEEILVIDENIFETAIEGTDDAATANLSQSSINKRYAIGGTIGAGIGAAVTVAKETGKDAGVFTAANMKKSIPYAIGGAILAATLGVLYNIVKKKITVKKLLAAETDPVKKEALKKEMKTLSTKELANLKKYKKQEALAKLKAETKLSSQDTEKLKDEAQKGIKEKERIDKLKQAITTAKDKSK